MPSANRNWCAHPCHLESFPDGTKKFTKFGPKPNHPVGSRRVTWFLVSFINRTCVTISNDPSLKLNENHSFCTKCYETEVDRFYGTTTEEMEMEKIRIAENSDESNSEDEMRDSPDLTEAKRDYAIEKLNEVFKMFQLGPIVP